MKNKKILVVDDDKLILDIVKDALEAFDFSVVVVDNTDEALKIFAKEDFDLILCDLFMKPMNGIEFSKYLFDNYQKIPPIIIMTGYGNVESVIETMKLGVKDYILKPFKITSLIQHIEKSIKNAEIENENLRLKEILEIYSVSEQINNSLNLSEITSIFVKNLQAIIKADVVALYLNDDFNILQPNKNSFAVRKKFDHIKYDIFNELPNKINLNDILKYFKNKQWKFYYTDSKIDINIDMDYKSIVFYLLKNADKIVGVVLLLNFSESFEKTKDKFIPLKILFDEAAIAIENGILYQKNQQMFLKTLQSLAMTIDAKDSYTHYHSTNVSKYSKVIAKKLGLSDEKVRKIGFGSLLHDIGKIGIPENILNKPTSLNEQEFEVIKQHPLIGKTILNPMKDQFPEMIDMIYYHHERFDGKGYPEGIGGDDIPLNARIVSLADAFDAMTSDRAYRQGLEFDIVISEINKNKGKQFHPEIVDAFFNALSEIKSLMKFKK
jgi:response regulator RpfG family c-di-GMP phosphodiesterase